jgi:hypothetical protein
MQTGVAQGWPEVDVHVPCTEGLVGGDIGLAGEFAPELYFRQTFSQ